MASIIELSNRENGLTRYQLAILPFITANYSRKWRANNNKTNIWSTFQPIDLRYIFIAVAFLYREQYIIRYH